MSRPPRVGSDDRNLTADEKLRLEALRAALEMRTSIQTASEVVQVAKVLARFIKEDKPD